MFAIFYQISVFPPNDSLQKLWKVFFISSKKFFSFSRYSNFCIFSPSFPHFPDTKEQMEVENLWCHELALHKFADAIFEITWPPFYITSSTLVRKYTTSKGIFLNFFRNLKSNWTLVPGPFCFWWVCPLKGTGLGRKNKVDFFQGFW